MHEFSAVESQVHALLKQLEATGVARVSCVRVRRGGTFSEAALRQAFEVTTVGTLLESVVLDIETKETLFECPGCGYSQIINADDMVAYLFICPVCDSVVEIEESDHLELLDAVLEETDESWICYWPH